MARKIGSWLVAAFMLFGLTSRAWASDTFVLDWIIYGKDAPFFAAKDFGYYKKEGLDINILRGYGSGDTARRIAERSGSFGFADAGAALGVRVEGGHVVEVAMIHARAPYAVYTLKSKNLHDAKAMKGYTIGSPIGNAARIVFPAFAHRAGLNPGDVSWVNMPVGGMLPSLLSGKVDAIVDYTTGGVTHMIKGKQEGKPVNEFRFTNVGFDIYSNGLIVHNDMIKENPGKIRGFVKATLEAWDHCLLYTQKCLNNFSKYVPGMTRDLVAAQYREGVNLLMDEGVKAHGLGWIDKKKMDYTIDVLTKYIPLKKRVPTKEVYTNEFLPQVARLAGANMN